MLRYVDHLVFDGSQLGNPQLRTLRGRTTDLDTAAASVMVNNGKTGVMLLDGSLKNVTTATVNKNNLSVLVVKDLPVLATLKIDQGSAPAVLDLDRLPSLNDVQAWEMDSSAGNVDMVLAQVRANADRFGIDGGTLDLSGSHMPTGGADNADYLGLVARAWTVSIGT